MSFPLDPIQGESHQIGSKTWYWDGATWNLMPNVVAGSGGSNSDVEVLDDLLDVDTGGPLITSDSYGYYIRLDPDIENGFGRYLADIQTKTIEFNKTDLDQKGLKELFDFTVPGTTTHRFSDLAENWVSDSRESKVVSKIEKDNSYVFEYEKQVTVSLIDNGGASVLYRVEAIDYKALVKGAILAYNREGDQLWRPEENRAQDASKITLSLDAPEENNKNGDVWVDSSKFYMYIYDDGMWIALTGPEGGTGGGDIAHNSMITMMSTRGMKFDGGLSKTTFNLNQRDNQVIDILEKNITTYAMNPPQNPNVGDFFVDSLEFYLYVWTGQQWLGLTGKDAYAPEGQVQRLEQPCRMEGGSPTSDSPTDPNGFCTGGTLEIKSFAHISPLPPKSPSAGDLWYDSEHLELRVFYVTPDAYGGWVSATHPAMRPSLGKEPNPPDIRLLGPALALENTETAPFKAVVGWHILEAGYPYTIEYESTDTNFKIVSSNEDNSIITAKFSKFGIHTVVATLTYVDENGDTQIADDSVTVSVNILPPGEPIVYHVRVVDGYSEDGDPMKVFNIDGENQPVLNLMRNREYRFNQSHPSNVGYPFRFYRAQEYNADMELTDDIGEEYTDGVQQIRNDVVFTVPATAPIRLRYGSPASVPMGWWIYPFDVDGSVNLETFIAVPTGSTTNPTSNTTPTDTTSTDSTSTDTDTTDTDNTGGYSY